MSIHLLCQHVSIFAIIVFCTVVNVVISTLDCWYEYECANSTIGINNTERIDCYGYSSCRNSESLITSGDSAHIYCHGSHSCMNVGLIQVGNSVIDCTGYKSCSQSTIVKKDDRDSIYCDGFASCLESTIYSNTNDTNLYALVDCRAPFACGKSLISTVEIAASSPYALYGSIVDSNGSYIKVELAALYSGKNLTIICRKGDLCDIDCVGNACNETYIYCFNEETSGLCDINCFFNGATGTDCVNVYYLNDSIINNSYTSYDVLTKISSSSNVEQVNAFTTIVNANKNCFNNTNGSRCSINDYWYYGDCFTNNHVLNSNNDSPFCCNSYRGCYGSEIISVNNNASDVKLFINGAVNMIGSNYVRFGNNVINGDMYCLASQSCQIINNVTMNWDNNNNIYCLGEASCQSCIISDVKLLTCSSEYSCAEVVTNRVSKIIVDGYNALGSASINSGGIDTKVYFNSYRAGGLFGTTINCNNSDVCKIYCSATNAACNKVVVNCYGICIIDCNFDDSVDWYCPTVNVFENGTFNSTFDGYFTFETTTTTTTTTTLTTSFIETTTRPAIATSVTTTTLETIATSSDTVATATSTYTTTSPLITNTTSSGSGGNSGNSTRQATKGNNLFTSTATTNNNSVTNTENNGNNNDDESNNDSLLTGSSYFSALVAVVAGVLLCIIIVISYFVCERKNSTENVDKTNNSNSNSTTNINMANRQTPGKNSELMSTSKSKSTGIVSNMSIDSMNQLQNSAMMGNYNINTQQAIGRYLVRTVSPTPGTPVSIERQIENNFENEINRDEHGLQLDIGVDAYGNGASVDDNEDMYDNNEAMYGCGGNTAGQGETIDGGDTDGPGIGDHDHDKEGVTVAGNENKIESDAEIARPIATDHGEGTEQTSLDNSANIDDVSP